LEEIGCNINEVLSQHLSRWAQEIYDMFILFVDIDYVFAGGMYLEVYYSKLAQHEGQIHYVII
jgi:hypothetical protein